MSRLADKVAIITGAARGQGEATARLFAAEGARVLIVDCLEGEGTAVATAIGSPARYMSGDVASEDDWSRIVAFTIAEFGKIDILVNNAAITDHNSLAELSRPRLETIMAVNLIGPMLGMQAVIPEMLKRGGGSVVNISSVNGLRGTSGMSGYDASKWALRGASKALALEFGGMGIRINTVHPGAIHTPMLDPDGTMDTVALARALNIVAGRVGEPVEVAYASLFLASDEASYINGAELAVDGGWSAGLKVPDTVDPNPRRGSQIGVGGMA